MCDCLNHVERELKDKLTTRVSEGGEISNSETGWSNQVIDFSF
ncbi:hypothetical protein [Proteus penneri]|nr:hypothetical protein [Proteus penneri]SUB99903.1 Uncharacterised protein [Proteus penneri]